MIEINNYSVGQWSLGSRGFKQTHKLPWIRWYTKQRSCFINILYALAWTWASAVAPWPLLSHIQMEPGLEYMLLVCIVSNICIFKMYIIQMAVSFIRTPLMCLLDPIPPHPPHTPTRHTWLTNVLFDAAYFMSLSPNTGFWLTWSLHAEVALPVFPCLHFFPPPLSPFGTPSPPSFLDPSLTVFVVAAAAEHALHWRSEALCLISSRQTDLWGFIDSKLHRGRHRAGSEQ